MGDVQDASSSLPVLSGAALLAQNEISASIASFASAGFESKCNCE